VLVGADALFGPVDAESLATEAGAALETKRTSRTRTAGSAITAVTRRDCNRFTVPFLSVQAESRVSPE
jgi:hypothetical protein